MWAAKRIVLSLVAAALLLAPPARGAAAEGTGAIQGLVDEGNRLFFGAHYDGALDRYRAALDASGARQLLFMIGRCYQHMERWEDAREAFEAFLTIRDIPDDAREKAKIALTEALRQLSQAELTLSVAPLGARVFVDDRLVGVAPVEPLTLAPGTHVVRVEADGHEPAGQSVPLPQGARTSLEIRLLRRVAAPPAEADGDGSPYSPWTWVTLGTGVALVAGGTVAFVLGDQDHQRIADAAGSGGADSPSGLTRVQALDLKASGDAKKAAGYALWGVGGAALVTSTVLFVLDATHEPSEAAIRVGGALAPGGAVLTLDGRF